MRGFGVSQFSRSADYVTAAARSSAYRQVFAGQPDRYCPVEIDLYGLGLLGAGRECRSWQSASR
jgi:hypothetical protein